MSGTSGGTGRKREERGEGGGGGGRKYRLSFILDGAVGNVDCSLKETDFWK